MCFQLSTGWKSKTIWDKIKYVPFFAQKFFFNLEEGQAPFSDAEIQAYDETLISVEKDFRLEL